MKRTKKSIKHTFKVGDAVTICGSHDFPIRISTVVRLTPTQVVTKGDEHWLATGRRGAGSSMYYIIPATKLHEEQIAERQRETARHRQAAEQHEQQRKDIQSLFGELDVFVRLGFGDSKVELHNLTIEQAKLCADILRSAQASTVIPDNAETEVSQG